MPLKIALQQCGNLAGLVAGLITADYSLISRSVSDVFAEPYRTQQLPEFEALKKSALESRIAGDRTFRIRTICIQPLQG